MQEQNEKCRVSFFFVAGTFLWSLRPTPGRGYNNGCVMLFVPVQIAGKSRRVIIRLNKGHNNRGGMEVREMHTGLIAKITPTRDMKMSWAWYSNRSPNCWPYKTS